MAEKLESTLGDMEPAEADEVVANQIMEIYDMLGYKVIKRPKKQQGFLGCVLLRKDSM